MSTVCCCCAAILLNSAILILIQCLFLASSLEAEVEQLKARVSYLEAYVKELAFNSHHLPPHSTNPFTSPPFNHCTMPPLYPLSPTSPPPNHFTSPSANSFTSPPQSISFVSLPSPISNAVPSLPCHHLPNLQPQCHLRLLHPPRPRATFLGVFQPPQRLTPVGYDQWCM